MFGIETLSGETMILSDGILKISKITLTDGCDSAEAQYIGFVPNTHICVFKTEIGDRDCYVAVKMDEHVQGFDIDDIEDETNTMKHHVILTLDDEIAF